jgi:hypothetical protein
MIFDNNFYTPKFRGPASFPLKQNHINTGITQAPMGMPQKFRYEDGTNKFSQGRKVFLNAPTCSSIINGPNLTSIRVDSNTPNCSDTIPNKNWSSSSIQPSMRSRHSKQVSSTQVNGKKSQVVAHDQYIQRIKNRAIGSGSTNKEAQDFSFKSNDKTHLNVTNHALRRARSGGTIAPPKKGAIANTFRSGGSGARAVYGGGDCCLPIIDRDECGIVVEVGVNMHCPFCYENGVHFHRNPIHSKNTNHGPRLTCQGCSGFENHMCMVCMHNPGIPGNPTANTQHYHYIENCN